MKLIILLIVTLFLQTACNKENNMSYKYKFIEKLKMLDDTRETKVDISSQLRRILFDEYELHKKSDLVLFLKENNFEIYESQENEKFSTLANYVERKDFLHKKEIRIIIEYDSNENIIFLNGFIFYHAI